jgi:hypothetical protein
MLEIDGLYDPENATDSDVNVDALLKEAVDALKPAPEEKAPEAAEKGVNSKYAINKDIIVVTYGEEGKAYKSFILNYNDYTVQTTYNGVIYTIGAYDYVVIEYAAQ